jgi:hypothetical protein
VAGCCEYGDEPAGSGSTDSVISPPHLVTFHRGSVKQDH